MPPNKRQPQKKKPAAKKPLPARRAPRASSQRISVMKGGTAVAGSIHCAEFVGGNKRITYGFTAKAVAHIVEKLIPLIARGGALLPADESGRALRIEYDGESLTFAPGAAQLLEKQHSRRSHLLALTLHQDYRAWATRFVPLAGKVDIRKTVEGMDIPVGYSEFRVPTGGEGQAAYEPLEDITTAVTRHPAFVILGDPGAGKTTTLQKIAYEAAVALLGDKPGRIPFFARLSQQKNREPFDFLEAEWRRRLGASFAQALDGGHCLLLIDGLNELPREDRDERLKDWRLFAHEYGGANQILFTGRERDYAGQLELPRVRVDALDGARIADYLRRHHAEGLAPQLADPRSRLGDLARNPFNLSLLVYAYQSDQREMGNRGRLLEWFVDNLFRREERLAHKGWLARDAQVAALARLAFAMQEQGESTTLDLKAARAIVPVAVEVNGEEVAIRPADLFRFARAATLLDPAIDPDIRFYHHLVQEYFAALELLRRFEAGEAPSTGSDLPGLVESPANFTAKPGKTRQVLSQLWQSKRLIDEMPPGDVGDWDPLPEPPATGWEVTTILACGLAPDPARLIEAVRPHNPNLARRCLDESGVDPAKNQAPKSQNPKLQIQNDLLAELTNPAVHLRARLQAGFTLGRIGDPRFELKVINGVKVIRPTLVDVPGGTYTIGSADDDPDAFDSEKPQHTVDLPAFAIGRWPVTNAEFACFMEAGGYKDDQWWKTELAKRWLRGEDVAGGQLNYYLNLWRFTQTNADWKAQLEGIGNFSPDQIQTVEAIAKMSEEDLRRALSKGLSAKSRERPEYWHDADRNNTSQPVVGLTWFEANAYCEWLSAIAGRAHRLPSEVEWEAAARGPSASLRVHSSTTAEKNTPRSAQGAVRVYPWGNDWDVTKANTIEGRVLKPSPVGAYAAAGGVGSFGIEDQTGNVWDWTSSLYQPYPYDSKDGREEANAEGERVVRGGSWDNDGRYARCASRYRLAPAFFTDYIGFRVLSPVSISGF